MWKERSIMKRLATVGAALGLTLALATAGNAAQRMVLIEEVSSVY